MNQLLMREILCFLMKKLSSSSEFQYLEPCLYLSITDIVEAMNTLIQKSHNRSENCITIKVSRRTHKVEIHLGIKRSALSIFSTDLGHIFGSNFGNVFGVMLKKWTSQTWFCLRHFPHTLFHDKHGLDWVKYRWRHKNSIAAFLSFCFEAQR